MAGKDTVAIRLTLDGAAEVKRQLDTLGKAGQTFISEFKKAGDAVTPGFGKAIETLGARITAAFTRAGAARDRFTSGLARTRIDLLGVGQAASVTATRIGLITGAITAAAGAAVLLGKNFINAADEADRMADRVGLSLKEFTGLAGVAKTFDIEPADLVGGLEKLNLAIEKGSDNLDDLDDSVQKVKKSTGDAAGEFKQLENVSVFKQLESGALSSEKAIIRVHRGAQDLNKDLKETVKQAGNSGGKQTIFEKLGLDLEKLRAQAPLERLFSISDALERIEDPSRRSALAIQLLGRGAGRLIALLGGGSGSLRTAIKEMERYGVVLGDAEQKTIQLADDGLDRLSLAFQGLGNKIGFAFAPLIGKVANAFAELIVSNLELVSSLAGVAAAYAELTLIDLANLLLGNDEAVSSTNQWLVTVKNAVRDFATFIFETLTTIIIPAFGLVRDGAQLIADSLNGLFGTEFTANQVLAAALALKLVGAFALLGSVLNLTVGAVNLLLAAGPALKLLFSGLFAAVRGLGAALLFIGGGLAALLGVPVAVGVAIAAAVAAAAVLIYVYFDDIAAYAEKTWNVISSLARDMAKDVAEAFGDVGKLISSATTGNDGEFIAEFKRQNLAEFAKFKQGLTNDVAAINRILASIGIDGPAIWKTFGDAAAPQIEQITTGIVGLQAVIGKLSVGDFAGAFDEAAKQNAEAFEDLKTSTLRDIELINKGLQTLGIDTPAIWLAIQQEANEALTAIQPYLDQLGSYAERTFADIRTGSIGLWDQASAGAQDAARLINQAFTDLPGFLDSSWELIKKAAGVTWDAVVAGAAGIGARLGPALDSIKGVLGPVWDGITAAAKLAWDGVVKVVTDAAALIADGVSAVARAALEAWSGASSSVEASARAIVDAISRATEISGDVQGAKELAAKLVAPFIEAGAKIETLLGALAGTVDSALGQILAKVNAAVASAKAALDSVSVGQQEALGLKFGAGAADSIVDVRAAQAQFQQLAASFESARQVIALALGSIVIETAAAAEGLKAALNEIGFGLSEGIFTAKDDVMVALQQLITDGVVLLQAGGVEIAAAWAEVIAGIADASIGLDLAWEAVLDGIVSAFDAAVSRIESLIDRLENKLDSLRRSIAAANEEAGGGGDGFARGGKVYGSGGPTQDNIPAWLSAGEFVIRNAAVQKLPLAFLKAINSGRYSLKDLLSRFSTARFAKGGIALPFSTSAPLRFASGGMVPAMPAMSFKLPATAPAGAPVSSLTLVMGDERFEGMSGPVDVVDRLAKSVQRKKLRSAGRVSAYGG